MRKSRAKQALAAATVAAALTGLTLPSDATAVTAATAAAPASDTATDSRDGTLVRPTKAQADALAAVIRSSPGTRATWDPRFGTPRTITPALGKALSGPRAGSALDDALGLGAADVAALRVRRDHVLPGTGTHVVDLLLSFDGLTADRGGSLGLAVRRDGSVLSYTGTTVRGGSLTGSFALSAGRALEGVAGVAGFVADRTGGKAGYDVFAKGPFAAPSYVKRVAFPTADGARAAYSVLFVKKLDQAWQVVVDAQSGKELYRRSLVQHDTGGTVYDNNPSVSKPRHVSFDATPESPNGYVDPTGLLGTGITTFGNNANAHANWSNYIAPVDPGPRPVSPTGQFDYPYADHWGTSRCNATSYPQDQEPASTNLFYQHNRIHDQYYQLGFTESGGNFQLDNFGKGGSGGDAVQGLVQAGALSGGNPTYTGRDNAYMLTLPDGIPPWSGMFLWEPIDDSFEGPCADGDFDAGVIQHEYSHGLSNRYVGTEDGALGTHQSGSMGEGWGDWYALDHLTREGYQSDSVLGGYVTGNKTRGIRNWAYDANPTTFGDIGYDLVGPEVHADGEIWTATLWQMLKALRATYGMQEGSDIAEHLVTDAMPLSPNDPSMLDERTAIMTALDNRYHARADFDTLVDTVYSVFAQRGMGLSAHNATSENDPTGGNDTDGVPGFDNRNPALNGVLSGTVYNASTGKPVEGARIMLGRFEARSTPVATTGPSGRYRVTATQASYPVTVQARGFGSKTFAPVAVAKGRTLAKNLALSPNLASAANGAKAVSGGAGKAMDDTEASSWQTPKGSKAVIKLARPATVTSLQVSGYTNSRFEGLKSFTLQTSTDGVNWRTRTVGGTNAFGYQTPRPVVPDLHYKTFRLPTPTKASYVRFWADAPQGGTKANVQVGDIQVFGDNGTPVTPTPPPPPDKPVSESFTIAAGNPNNLVSPGVVGTELENTCTVPPASQDSDGHVSTLKGEQGDGQHAFRVAAGATAVDVDVYLYDASCRQLASYATESANEAGSIPSGTAYILTSLYAGAAADITLTITDTQ
ncbi:MAG: coagulation factor 5/8 type-like protein [Nocardioidaceae bacterium]|nr:coagulation factor 5/8 type-like protein [Nocardioidaceae bacterium]